MENANKGSTEVDVIIVGSGTPSSDDDESTVQDNLENQRDYVNDKLDEIDYEKYENWIDDNLWLLGIVDLVFGFVIALWGVNLFPVLAASLVAIFTIGVTCSLTAAFGWMDTTWGTWLCIILAFTLGIVFGCITRRNIWLLIALTGLVGGFFSGAVIDSAIVASTGWNAVWFYWFMSCLMGAIGCILSCFFGKALVMITTSGIGSYLFMRAWTYFFPGHYPSE